MRTEMLFLTAERVLDLADAIAPELRVLVVLAAYTGLRAGEIGALRVGRIDTVGGTVNVKESLAERARRAASTKSGPPSPRRASSDRVVIS